MDSYVLPAQVWPTPPPVALPPPESSAATAWRVQPPTCRAELWILLPAIHAREKWQYDRVRLVAVIDCCAEWDAWLDRSIDELFGALRPSVSLGGGTRGSLSNSDRGAHEVQVDRSCDKQ